MLDFATIPFLIDTGAAFTAIHALDAIRFLNLAPSDLDSSTWERSITGIGIGGAVKYRPIKARVHFF